MNEPVEGVPVADRIAVFDTERAGVFAIVEEDETYIWAECPCGCGGHFRLRLYREGTPKPENRGDGSGPAWSWNGDLLRPTLQPSIRDKGGCFFHGHLTNGVWTFEGDSGVKA